MQLSHKIELKPNNCQVTYFNKSCGVARFTYNWALNEWNTQYIINKNNREKDTKKITGFFIKKKFNYIKNDKFSFVKDVTKYASEQSFLDLQDAWTRFFKGLSERPRFKKKNKSKSSFYIGGADVKIEDKHIFIPKLGRVRLKESFRCKGKINYVRVSKRAGKWFASIQVLNYNSCFESEIKKNKSMHFVGMDLGIKSIITTSDGFQIENPRSLKKIEQKLARAQKKISKKRLLAKKSGNNLSDCKNYQKQKLKVEKMHYKISNQRKDIQHKLTSYITKNYSHIAIEDLNVKGMVKNHNLAKALSDVGFGELRRQIEYKSKWLGNQVTYVDRWFPSSKMCSSCGCLNEDLKLSDRIYNCDCGLSIDRDLNAAMNIRNNIKDNDLVGKAFAELKPVEITAMQKRVHPAIVTSIIESGSEPKIESKAQFL